jgi:hypothetical protein
MDWDKFAGVKRELLTEKLKYLQDEGVAAFKQELLTVTGRKQYPNWGEQTLIEEIFYTSWPKRDKKEQKVDYYLANGIAFDLVVKWLIRARRSPNLYNLLKQLLRDARRLFDLFRFHFVRRLQSDPDVRIPDDFGIPEDPFLHPYELYAELTHVFFGDLSEGLLHNCYISLIRQAIEARVRWAFGVLGKHNSKENVPGPVSLGQIFKVLKKDLKEHNHYLESAVPIQTLERIYSWANICTHIGLKDFIWKPVLAMKHLEPLFLNRRDDSIDSGIVLDAATLNLIRDLVAREVNRSSLDKPDRPIYRLVTRIPVVKIVPGGSDEIEAEKT